MKLFSFVLVLMFSISSNATKHICAGIVEKNDLYISVDDKRARGITEAEFNEVLDKAYRVYNPEFVAKKATFNVKRSWTDGTVNAYASQSGKTWTISMFGGLARHETITKDGFMLVACHEIGHHLGGAVKNNYSWASNEGQSDYFANLKCLRKVFADEDNELIVSQMTVDEHARKECEAEFQDRQSQLICMRGAMAGMSVANLFKALRKETRQPLFNEIDAKVVTTTNHAHPATQCRLDTYFNGSRCSADLNTDVSDTDYKVGTCDENSVFNTGSRPRCWFAMPKATQ